MTGEHQAPADDGVKLRKVDVLKNIETEMQKQWQEKKLFEVDAPAPDAAKKDKFMVTFPYPYQNGRLHLGHSFSLSKAEFAVGFERLKGKNALFPFGFHASGMPIKTCADKLARELEQYGNPPVFPIDEPVPVAHPAGKAGGKGAKGQGKAGMEKSKNLAKTGGVKYQWQIMESSDIPKEMIHKFTDPEFWLDYFPPCNKADLERMGLKVDWRRTFITTPINKYYDSFVRWQFNNLKAKKRVKFGNRPTIFSPKDGQPCMDHDRATGEGVDKKAYTLIKMELLEPRPKALEACAGMDVFFVAGTLRPETMPGQTNCWVNPDIEYGAFAISDTQAFVCTYRAARNLAWQGQSRRGKGEVDQLCMFKGQALLGAALKSPHAVHTRIYCLPMCTVKANMGTGVVTSVPSDSPDDFINLVTLQNPDPKKREWIKTTYGLEDEHILPFEIVPIIHIPGVGDVAAKTFCELYKVQGPKDDVNLAKAKDDAYLKGFDHGVLVAGPCKGLAVKEAKEKLKAILIEEGHAVSYYEPESLIMSRSGDECVVALTDQWYLDYGNAEWKERVHKCIAHMDNYHTETDNNLSRAVDWLHEWACSRSFGLGTKVPWDERYLIESLSDSTIYMAFYTVAHLLCGGTYRGEHGGPSGITSEQMTDNAWDYVFFKDAPVPTSGVDVSQLNKLKHEFNYWYPLDLRVSGKDLVPNHYTFSLFNHCAIWDKEEDKWPNSFRANGHLTLDGDKMSKSLGNFITLAQALDRYGADAMRFALADAGDDVTDANFETSTADAIVLRLYTENEWIGNMLTRTSTSKDKTKFRDGPSDELFADRAFASEINQLSAKCYDAYDKMLYRDAITNGFYQLLNARDRYREMTQREGVNVSLITTFIETLAITLSPVCPHICDKWWSGLGHTTSVVDAKWPDRGLVDEALIEASKYVQEMLHDTRLKRDKKVKKGKKLEPAPTRTKVTLYVADEFPKWQSAVMTYMKEVREQKGAIPENKEILQAMKTHEACSDPKLKKKLGPFVAFRRDMAVKGGALDLALSFDEKKVLEENIEYISRALELEVTLRDAGAQLEGIDLSDIAPGAPVTVFE